MSVLGARTVVRGIQRLVPKSRTGLRILCYHLVGGETDSAVDIPLDDFEHHMLQLSELSQPAGLFEGLAAAEQVSSSSASRTIVTFDDAYANFVEHAWPVLQRHRIPVTLFVPTEFVDGSCAGPLRGVEGQPALSWRQLRELTDTGLVTIGAHTRTHPDLRRLDPRQLRAELDGGRDELEDRLGVAVEAFCYPRGLWDRRVEAEVRQAYKAAVIGGGRRVAPGRVDRYRLPRTSVRRRPALPIRKWLEQPIWLEEAIADVVRRRA